MWPVTSDEVALSGKCRVLFALLRGAAARGERTLLFSQSLHLIDLLEAVLKRRTRPAGDMKWKRGRDYMRLDGTTPQAQRQRLSGKCRVLFALLHEITLSGACCGAAGAWRRRRRRS